MHRIFSRSSSKRCDKCVKIARNTLEGNRLDHPRYFSPSLSFFFPFPLLLFSPPFPSGEDWKETHKIRISGFVDLAGRARFIPSLRTVKTVTPCWFGARPSTRNLRQRGLNPKRKSQGSMLIPMIDEARTNLCLA